LLKIRYPRGVDQRKRQVISLLPRVDSNHQPFG
jgi:hypothetical protein